MNYFPRWQANISDGGTLGEKHLRPKVSKDVDYSAIRLHHAARIPGCRETVIVGPIRRLMRDRSKAGDLEHAHDIDTQIDKHFDELETYLTKEIR